jgi:hypothetical protein
VGVLRRSADAKDGNKNCDAENSLAHIQSFL